ncbi:MAG: hypothetical protein Q8L02_00875 [Candidatus Nitrotoga sp.]|nr:hypothetical protein [Candidatus Nitrotoga sp.]
MIPIEPPLVPGNEGERVANLQDALLLLIEKKILKLPEPNPAVFLPDYLALLTEDRSAKAYSKGTSMLMILFRDQFEKEFQLTPGEDVDKPTAVALNTLLKQLDAFNPSAGNEDHQFILCGQVVNTGGPVNGILVSVFDRDLFFGRQAAVTGQLLGSIPTKRNPETGVEGWFELTYSTSQFASGDIEKGGNTTPDLVFALSMDGQAIESFTLYRLPDGHDLTEELLVSKDDRILGIPGRKKEEVRFVISGGELKQEESEYDRIWRAILPLVADQLSERADEAERERVVCTAAAQFDEEKHRDISFVARETDLDWALIRTFADASKLSVDPFRQDVPVSVLYGLARTRGASDFYRLSLLSEDDLRLGLEEATAGTKPIIPSFDSADHLKEIVQLLRKVLARHLPNYRVEEGATTLADLIGTDIPDREDQITLWRTFSEHSGTPAEFWDKVKGQPGFEDESKVNKVKYAFQLGWLVQNNMPLANAVRNKHPEILSTVELAFHLDTTDKWGALLNDTVVAIPSDVPGATDSERKENYAASLAVAMQVAHPTVAIANMVAMLPSTQLANVQPVVSKFLADAVRTAQFDFISDRIDDLVEKHGDKLLEDIDEKDRPIVVDQVKRLQRLFRLSCGPESMKALIDAGFNAARDIAELPPDVAMDILRPTLGETTARIILNRAGNISSEALHQYVFFNGLINDKGLNGEFL